MARRIPPPKSAEHYVNMPQHAVGGWLDFEDLYAVKKLSDKQHSMGVFGSVGEIGVHHGLLFIGLALSAYTSEPLFAADVFADQVVPITLMCLLTHII